MSKSLNYKDVHLVPNYSNLTSRKDANTKVKLGNREFELPVVPANMASCISFEKAEWLAQNGYFYILHRFYEYSEIIDWLRKSSSFKNATLPYVSISLGIQKRDVDFIHEIIKLKKHGVKLDYVTVDVAHGDHEAVLEMLRFLNIYKAKENPEMFIIGGNIATTDAYLRMITYVDAVKVGIACGASCITYNKTGFASPMFSTVKAISEERDQLVTSDYDILQKPLPLIIADGGIGCNGDIAKAFVAGADFVMAGSMFARCIDSPALVDPTDPTKKLYFGSASSLNGNKKNIEGKTISMPMNGMTYAKKLEEIQQDLSSAISYAGGNDLTAFEEVEWKLI
jgi:GMP reductase